MIDDSGERVGALRVAKIGSAAKFIWIIYNLTSVNLNRKDLVLQGGF